MGDTDPSRHLGLDLGATNIKWAAVERLGDAWTCLDRGQSPTGRSDGADEVIARMVGLARDARSRWPDVESIGLGVPGLFDAGTGVTTFLPRVRVTDLEAVEIVIAEHSTWAGAIGAAVHGAEVSTAAAVVS